MRKLFAFFAVTAFISTAWAQLPNGSTAPDFTMTDINGESHNLQSYLDQGMSVILNFSAVWCGPCFAYKEEGVLNDIYNAFGPNGTGDIMVLSFETQDDLGIEALNGEGPGTVGDFVSGVNYPIIDNASNLYWSSYMQAGAESGPVPLIYTICPDGILTETGQATLQSHVSTATLGCGVVVDEAAASANYSGDETNCGSGTWDAKADLVNLGALPVTSATFEVDFNGNTNTVNWSGNLGGGGTVTADLGSYQDAGNFEAVLTQINGEPRNTSFSAVIQGSTNSTNMVVVNITPDCWPEESSWEIRNESGGIVESQALAGETAGQESTWIVELPNLGCYTFHMLDTYGDGLNGCQWTGDNCSICGQVKVYSYDGTQQVSTILDLEGAANDGDVAYTERIAPFEVTSTATQVDELSADFGINVFPNPTSGKFQLEFVLYEATDVTLEIRNTLGQIVHLDRIGASMAGQNLVEINMDGYESGLYTLVLSLNDQVVTSRITKK